jgi:serine/threonine protein kinase
LLLEGRYELSGRIGPGSFTEIWRARELANGRNVVIKAVNPDLVKYQIRRNVMRHEFNLLRQAAYPSVAEVYELIEHENLCFIAMESFSMDFGAFTSVDPVARQWVAPALLRVLDALEHCHRLGIAHRDIKPRNILVRIRDGNAVVKLCDFDAAIPFDAAGKVLVDTGPFRARGTSEYWAPEKRKLYERAQVTAGMPPELQFSIEIASDIYAVARAIASKFPRPGIGRSYPSHRFSGGL